MKWTASRYKLEYQLHGTAPSRVLWDLTSLRWRSLGETAYGRPIFKASHFHQTLFFILNLTPPCAVEVCGFLINPSFQEFICFFEMYHWSFSLSAISLRESGLQGLFNREGGFTLQASFDFKHPVRYLTFRCPWEQWLKSWEAPVIKTQGDSSTQKTTSFLSYCFDLISRKCVMLRAPAFGANPAVSQRATTITQSHRKRERVWKHRYTHTHSLNAHIHTHSLNAHTQFECTHAHTQSLNAQTHWVWMHTHIHTQSLNA